MALIDLGTADSEGYLYPTKIPLMSKYINKEFYKKLGAEWSNSAFLWITDSGSVSPLNVGKEICEHLPDVLADNFYFATSTQQCWACRELSRVYCIVVRFFVSVEASTSIPNNLVEDIVYCFNPRWVTLMDCTAFDDETEREIKKKFPKYRADYSKTKARQCYMNHCEHCDAKLGDFFMHGEPGGAFFPTDYAGGARIRLTRVLRKILIQGEQGAHSTSDYFDAAQID